jgi:hypothetical protein
MPFFPGSLLPWIQPRFVTVTGAPLALGTLESFEAGTATPLATYVDPNFAVANPVLITLDANGCPPNPVYLLPQGYKFTVRNAAGVIQAHYPLDNVVDVGQVFGENFGVYQFLGSKNVASGYIVDPDTDHTITVASTGGPSPAQIFLPPAADARWPLTIKNMGTEPLQIEPDGTDTIDTVNASLAIIPAAASPIFPAITLLPDGVSAWLVVSSHGVV